MSDEPAKKAEKKIYKKQKGVPEFEAYELSEKQKDYVVLIPILNEGERIRGELARAKEKGIPEHADIVICDGGSTDGSTERAYLRQQGVKALLVKTSEGRQGAQLRMGFFWAFERGYKGIITIDGNGKDSIEDVPRFIAKLEEGYDFIQGSRFVPGGEAVRTPAVRHAAIRLIHAPVISWAARFHYTDTTNAFRGYSVRYLTDERVQPLREIFITYELLAYLSIRAPQIGLKTTEIPVSRVYPKEGKTPTKISFFKGNWELFRILFKAARGDYDPPLPIKAR